VLMTLYSDESPQTPPQVIVGRDISERGLGFYHSQPISFRAGIVVCDLPDGGQTAFEIDITWCRFARHGWYESGRRLLRVAPPPAILPEVATASSRASSERGALARGIAWKRCDNSLARARVQ